ncbi:replication-associated recombination protein A [Sporomusa acidovorans]|uniref:Replication-associated recombination protein A n=1 Tax=Sporomusa acidovorans (strain ATCC 49682 / DSM 3132 / Mol) TaxID=1123286 RepID=A0ABZ3J2I1_SPOA4|nr:replication-associated recombination protein A [Sporomusa acidovorans]OZC19723.1 replication-associated recombination protein A [Sporomusa acidovorans DSM 3132]SDF75974.1 putative ATPase [Sporomusa acidovorans]
MSYTQGSFFENVHKAPLADRVRPRNFEEYIGQEHILGKGKVLRQLIESDNITSMILWGPPGVGKTTIAMIMAEMTNAKFITFSAVTSGIKEIKEIMSKAEQSRLMGERTVIFIDEIHRFNKAQQDAFLPHVEKGNIILIGATTENPSFEVNSALLSRSRVFVLHSLQKADIIQLLKNALKDERGYGDRSIDIADELLGLIAVYANGDARTALNVLEMAVMSGNMQGNTTVINKDIVEDCIQKKALLYDKNGEEHYNLISALHKSMRNSDPDASVYWLARMLEAGEEPLFIARRLVRFASEDIGLAEPRALEMAIAVYNAVHYLGMPECNVHLTQAVVYLSIVAKSNALYVAYEKAKKDAHSTLADGVPLHLRNAPTKLMKTLNYGKGYQYAHDFEDKIVNMQCLPENLKDRQYYYPTSQGIEKNIKERLEFIKKQKSNKPRN